ncbi:MULTISPECIES: glycosyltransferase family 2 protein [Niastella]|uniref:Glycosyltransferase family 2 protein n=1 Tax=Niastella soli TaxID=2821487 RepID=A0ABS3Z368_9BACT|nr:glycosyltransferase family 2 protein [Niastella soli]MBO9204579.1 glycosyltransferase family 2 protein [Niastella soli]
MPGLSVIIVNYKTPQLLTDCLATFFTGNSQVSLEVIVVDNASGDNSQEIVTRAFPLVKWVQMGYNAGFARANNEGIRQATGDVVLLLNSDTLNVDNAIEQCYQQFKASAYIACGVQLLNADGSPQISGNYFMKGGLNYLLPLPYLGSFIKWLGNVVKVEKPNVPDSSALVEVDWINGAFLMVKRTAIDKAGLLDEDFFLYAEEAEWCSRLHKTGKLCIYGQYKVVHLQGESANEAFGSSGKGYYNLYDRKGLQIMLSNFLRIRKQFGIGWFLVQLAFYLMAIPVFFIASFFDNVFRLRNPFANFGMAARFAANVGRIVTFTPRILSNKPYFYKVL